MKRAPPPTQFAQQITPQMQNNLAAQQQQFLQQQQAALQQGELKDQRIKCCDTSGVDRKESVGTVPGVIRTGKSRRETVMVMIQMMKQPGESQ